MCNCKHCRERLNEPWLTKAPADATGVFLDVYWGPKCVYCHTLLEQDYGRAIITSGPYAFSKRKSGSHCPNCGIKYVRDVDMGKPII